MDRYVLTRATCVPGHDLLGPASRDEDALCNRLQDRAHRGKKPRTRLLKPAFTVPRAGRNTCRRSDTAAKVTPVSVNVYRIPPGRHVVNPLVGNLRDSFLQVSRPVVIIEPWKDKMSATRPDYRHDIATAGAAGLFCDGAEPDRAGERRAEGVARTTTFPEGKEELTAEAIERSAREVQRHHPRRSCALTTIRPRPCTSSCWAWPSTWRHRHAAAARRSRRSRLETAGRSDAPDGRMPGRPTRDYQDAFSARFGAARRGSAEGSAAGPTRSSQPSRAASF